MIDLKQVAELAKQDAELRQYITWVFRDSPECTFRRLAETAIEMAEQLTSDLAKRAVKSDDTTH
jgi:hypothetical protein